jgi:hypothetical protein
MVALTFDHGLEPYYRRELLARWTASNRATRRRGREWYPVAGAIMSDLARETGYTVEQCVAVLAITSPGAQLVSNLRWTSAIMRGETDTGGRFPNANRPKIAAVLASPEHAAEYVRGPKVGPFFRAILGENALVLDRWAMFAAQDFGDVDRNEIQNLRPVARRALVDAYKRAARTARTKVRDFQATVWIQTRENTPRIGRNGKYTTVRFADITSA